MKIKHTHLLIAPLLLPLVACTSSTTSDKVKTERIQAKFDVVAKDNQGIKITAELNVKDEFGKNIALTNGEYLQVRAGSQTKKMVQEIEFLDIDYEARFDGNFASKAISLDFFRDKQADMLNSRVVLPDNFSLTYPQREQLFRAGDKITINWTPSKQVNEVKVQASYFCNRGDTSSSSSNHFTVPDSGEFTFDTSIEENRPDIQWRNTTCDLELTLQKYNQGTLASGFHSNSHIQAYQQRSVSVRFANNS